MDITLRLAEKKDLMPVFNLSNEDFVRQNSFSSKKIKLDEHKAWFSKKLKDKNYLILIAENQEVFVGTIRLEMSAIEENVMGISISKTFRGKGLGSQLISEALEYVKKNKPEIKEIIAYIKINNIASIKSFDRAGFKLDRELELDRNKALRCIYNLKSPRSTHEI